MPLLLRAIITGFGYKLGAEVARYVATRVGLVKPDKAAAEQTKEDIPDGISHVPDEGEDEPDLPDDELTDDEAVA
jgi:hypothetical protein